MKLTVATVRNQGARLCKLTEVGRQGTATLETPYCMLYTRTGSCAHLSKDMVDRLQNVPEVLQVSLSHTAEHMETIEGFKKGIAKFAAFDDKLVFSSIHDPATEVKSGFNDKSGVGVWGKGGKIKLEVEGFLRLQEALQPDWFQCLSDADTNKDSTKKRAGKAVARTLTFLDQIMEGCKKSEVLKKASVFGSIVGGFDARERERCVKETVARGVDGFVIEGFNNLGPSTEQFNISDISEIMKLITKHLPEDKPRVMSGVWRPDAVMEAIELGVDIFDSSYPYIATERGHALVFDFNYNPDPEKGNVEVKGQQNYTIDLNEKCYFDDVSPLLPGCSCYACQKFTRAYVNHLLNTSELLSLILLMIHNSHHFFQFFIKLRQALADDKWNDLKQLIVKQASKNTTNT